MPRSIPVALVGLLLVGCYQSHEGGPLVGRLDAGPRRPLVCPAIPCPSDSRCEDGACVPAGGCGCVSDADCTQFGCLRARCEDCVCFLTPDPALCEGEQVCIGGGDCVELRDVECETDADCPTPPPTECGRAVCDHCRCFVAAAEICDGACDPEDLSCVTDDDLLAVDVQSDFVPGMEAAHVRVLSSGRFLVGRPIAPDEDLLGGVRVDTVAVPIGRFEVTVELLGPDKATLAERRILLDVDSMTVVTVVVSR